MLSRAQSSHRMSCIITPLLAAILPSAHARAADSVVSYDPGTTPAVGYTDPSTVLGMPERDTGEMIFPGVVSPFNPPWLTTEIVSIGAGGQLTVQFDSPIVDDPSHPYGIDFIVYGNTFMVDAGGEACGTPCVLSSEGGVIEVSSDGVTWVTIPDVEADGFAPPLGYRDATAYQELPGRVPTDPTLPIDPDLLPMDFDGADLPTIDGLYYGAMGGAGVDLADVDLAMITQVRIVNSVDSQSSPEIDAIVAVTPRLVADVNFSGAVNIDDLFLVINDFGVSPAGGPATDTNRNGVVNIDDLFDVINAWTR